MRTMLTTVNVFQIIISDIAQTVYIRLILFYTFQICCLFWTICLLRSFHSNDAHHGNYGERCSNYHFRRSAHIVYHIYSVCKIFEIAVCFAHFGFYEGFTPMLRTMVTMVNVVQIIISDVEHTLYITFTVFAKLSKLHFVLHTLAFTKSLLRWCAPSQLWWTFFKSLFPTLRPLFISHSQCFETFRNCCSFCTFWLLRSFYSDDVHHGNYGERCSNHHFRRWEHNVYHI